MFKRLCAAAAIGTLVLGSSAAMAQSINGAINRHGPHHGAQKSTKTVVDAFNTSCSNAASVKSETAEDTGGG